MGIDILTVHGVVPGLLLLTATILGYVVIARRWANVRGPSFFLPTLLLGTVAFAALFGGWQLYAVAASGATVRPTVVAWTIGSFALAGLAGSWLSCRSMLKSIQPASMGSAGWGTLRAFGAFWVGLVVATAVAAVAVITLGQR